MIRFDPDASRPTSCWRPSAWCASNWAPRRRSSASPARRSPSRPTRSRARPRRTSRETKKFFYREPEAARRLLALLAETTRDYLLAQVAAGAQAIQIFDSWVGVVSPDDWERYVLEPTKALVAAVRASGVPVIYFGNGATTILDRIAAVGADVYGIDWRLPLDEARARLGGAAAVQGNLDPVVLLGPIAEIERRAADVVRRGGGRGHIFNLGHGILPETPIEGVEALVRTVRGA